MLSSIKESYQNLTYKNFTMELWRIKDSPKHRKTSNFGNLNL